MVGLVHKHLSVCNNQFGYSIMSIGSVQTNKKTDCSYERVPLKAEKSDEEFLD